ncbi:hypothetical protein FGIG_11625 [Fasciola gigantica]|uniref:Uncharacterized protein n=1 Tax=Fasciola gigantica TaxID=46835 RepID=A0A504Y558_FASGI|nr:hypothetical protein FGIG_11625 [Fasciola gigantica]
MSNVSPNHTFHHSSVNHVECNHSTRSFSHSDTELDRVTTVYLRLLLFICISVLIFVLSQPWTESYVVAGVW